MPNYTSTLLVFTQWVFVNHGFILKGLSYFYVRLHFLDGSLGVSRYLLILVGVMRVEVIYRFFKENIGGISDEQDFCRVNESSRLEANRNSIFILLAWLTVENRKKILLSTLRFAYNLCKTLNLWTLQNSNENHIKPLKYHFIIEL